MQKWLASLVEVAGCMTIFPGKVDKMVCVCIGNVVMTVNGRHACDLRIFFQQSPVWDNHVMDKKRKEKYKLYPKAQWKESFSKHLWFAFVIVFSG